MIESTYWSLHFCVALIVRVKLEVNKINLFFTPDLLGWHLRPATPSRLSSHRRHIQASKKHQVCLGSRKNKLEFPRTRSSFQQGQSCGTKRRVVNIFSRHQYRTKEHFFPTRMVKTPGILGVWDEKYALTLLSRFAALIDLERKFQGEKKSRSHFYEFQKKNRWNIL